MSLLVLYLGVFAAIWACEEVVDPTVSDPSVSIFFLNKDSLDKVNVIIDSLDKKLETYDSTILVFEDSADVLVDSLIVLADTLANGGDFEEDSITVAENLIQLNIALEIIEKEDSTVNSVFSEWNSTASSINSGAVKLESILNAKNELTVFYEDSSTSWKLPLDMQADNIDVDIAIEGSKTYNLKLNYSRTTTANEKNKVVIRTSDFEIVSTDFNNPSLSCDNCDDTNTTIYVEF